MKTLLVSSFLLLAATFSCADVLSFKNGDRLTGSLKGIHSGNISFETSFGRNLSVPLRLIENIETEGEFEVHFKDSTVIRVFDSSVDLENLVLAQQHSTRLLKVTEGWNSRLNTGLQVSTGNSNTENLNLSGETIKVAKNTETTINGSIARESSEAAIMKEQLALGVSTKFYYQENWFGSAHLDTFRDPIKDIDSRVSTSLGLGHRFWEHTYSLLTAEVGISRVWEEFDIQQNQQQFGLRWEINYKKVLFGGKIEAYHKQTGLGLPDNDKFVLASSNGIRYLLSDRYDLDFRTELQHESDPVEGKKPTDLTYIASLGVSF
ncbi:MAG: DUF481 domain-containing protein [Gammaproteobacteria bacterium]|nr:DUF481 domain-containing protein [Gammaproteobacteria bacterium]